MKEPFQGCKTQAFKFMHLTHRGSSGPTPRSSDVLLISLASVFLSFLLAGLKWRCSERGKGDTVGMRLVNSAARRGAGWCEVRTGRTGQGRASGGRWGWGRVPSRDPWFGKGVRGLVTWAGHRLECCYESGQARGTKEAGGVWQEGVVATGKVGTAALV